MLLSELFEHLASGELAQLSMGDIDDLIIAPEDYPKVIPTVNLALTEIYKRFPIKLDEVIIRQQEGISVYILHNKYAMSNSGSSEPVKYIHDSIYQPFVNNVLRIERAYNELGMEIPINEDIDYHENYMYSGSSYQPFIGPVSDYDFQSIKTPTYNSIQVLPHPIIDNNTLVEYRAMPAVILPSPDLIPGEVEIDVPLSMLEPLLLYIGGRIHANMNASDPNSGAGFIAKFEASCKKIEELNLFNKGNVTNTKLERTGWV